MHELSKNEIDVVAGGGQAASLAAIVKAVQKANTVSGVVSAALLAAAAVAKVQRGN